MIKLFSRKSTKLFALFTLSLLISTGPVFAVDPREAARDASLEALDAYDAATLAIQLVEAARKQCSESFDGYEKASKTLASKSGLLSVCSSLDTKIAKFKSDLNSQDVSSQLGAEQVLKRIDFYNSMTDLANSYAEQMDAITVSLEDLEPLFGSILDMVKVSQNIVLLVDLELMELSEKLVVLPKTIKSQIENNTQFRSLKAIRSRALTGKNRIEDSIDYLPKVNSFKLLEEEVKRLREISSEMPEVDDVSAAAKLALLSLPQFICKKGANVKFSKSDGKCPSGFKKIRLR